MNELQPYQQRVVEERRELNERLEKLRAFTESARFAGLAIAEQHALTSQEVSMAGYLYALDERLALWGVKP
jgi:pyridoxine 5'-phosphate synthase PdxJ